MADESIIVRMRLVGAAAMARDAKRVEQAITGLGVSQTRAATAAGALTRGAGLLQRGMAGVRSGVSSVASGLSTMESAARRGAMALGTVATVAGGFLAATGAKYNAMIDQQRIAFTAMTGSGEKAAAIMERIQKLAEESPSLDPANVGEGISRMMAYGLTVEQAFEAVQRIGDMAPVAMKSVPEAMSLASLALGQIVSKGKLSAEELNQLAESVAVSRKAVAAELGMTGEEMESAMRSGAISADEALTAIFKSMEKKAAGASRQMAESTAGEIDRFREAWSSAAGAITRRFYDRVGDVIGRLAERMGDIDFAAWGDRAYEAAARVGNAIMAVVGRIPWDRVADMAQGVMARAAELAPKIGAAIGAALSKVPAIAAGVMSAVRQVIDAIRPAIPFVQNVVAPLLKGVLVGVIASVVAAFKVLVPVLKVTATGIGWIGKAAKPISPAIELIGKAIGFIVAGPILKGIAAVGKTFAAVGGIVGKVGQGIALAARIASAPIKALAFLLRAWLTAGRVAAQGIGIAVGALSRTWTYIVRWVGFMSGLPGRFARIAVNMVTGFFQRLGGMAARLRTVWAEIVGAIKGFASGVFAHAQEIGRRIVQGIVDAIKASPGLIASAIAGIVPAPLRGALGFATDAAGAVGEVVGDVLGGIGSIFGRAHGGVVQPGELTLVGERGPELVRAPIGSRVHTAGETRRMLTHAAAAPAGDVGPIHLTITLDGEVVHRSVQRVERRKEGRR